MAVGTAYHWPSECSARRGLSSAREFEAPLLAGLAKVQGNQEVAHMMPFRIGADASCTDGACGQVSRIIVNPATREVTHLVVDPNSPPPSFEYFPSWPVEPTIYFEGQPYDQMIPYINSRGITP